MNKGDFMWGFWICSIISCISIGMGFGYLTSKGWGWLMLAVCFTSLIPLSLWIDKKVDL